MNNKAVILLSGGLDSVVSVAIAKEKYEIEFALTFDYGQKPFKKELEASKKVCEFYGIKQKILELDWLKNLENKEIWIPNRNGLFINTAGTFCDFYGISNIIFGANAQEAADFSDNTKEFVEAINKSLFYSTKSKTKVIAPLIDLNKTQTVKLGLDLKAPLEFVMSCYENQKKHCGKCPSCSILKEALIKNNATELINILF